MSRLSFLPVGLLLLASVIIHSAPIAAQGPPAKPSGVYQPTLPPPLYVKMIGPEGMQVTFYRGSGKSTTLKTPCVVGLRPGYAYQVKLSNIPGHPFPLYPTLEVRGSLVSPGGKVKPRDFPASLVFTEAELANVRADGLVTKIVVLEKIQTASAEAATIDVPLLTDVGAGENPYLLARDIGTPMMIMRLGQREVTEEELMAHGMFGTVQLPDETALPLPQFAPYLPWTCPAFFDPLLGPQAPGADLCLPNGGAVGTRVGFDIDGKLAGLDPSDTVAEYVDSKGNRKIAISNRVCVCVPRFVVVRGEIRLVGQSIVYTTGAINKAQYGQLMKNITPIITEHQNVMVGVLATRLGLSSTLNALGTVVYGQIEGLEIYVNVKGPRGISTLCKNAEEAELPEVPLCLIKWPDKYGALLGDTITFTLKYTNQGGKVIHDVIISDSLLSRYEYIVGSQQSDRAATFTTQLNEVGSQILRWQINEDLPPGQSGIVRFQVKVK